MVKPSDGRTIKGCTHQAEAFALEESTKWAGDRLSMLLTSLTRASVFQRSRILVVETEDLVNSIDALGDKILPIPTVTSQLLVSREVKLARKSKGFHRVHAIVAPFASAAQFDPLAPRYGSIKGVAFSAKAKVYNQVYLKETVTVRLGGSAASLHDLLFEIKSLERDAQKIDIFELSAEEAGLVRMDKMLYQHIIFTLDPKSDLTFKVYHANTGVMGILER